MRSYERVQITFTFVGEIHQRLPGAFNYFQLTESLELT